MTTKRGEASVWQGLPDGVAFGLPLMSAFTVSFLENRETRTPKET
ncbi:MAG: hypothetical protein RIQ93_2855, partial [Verrucomicrobiota bacterium]